MKQAWFRSAVATLGICPAAWANLAMDTVVVTNPGNAPDTRYSTPGYGDVGYTFAMGKFEVTAGQYAEFLNAVAAMDTYGLYNTQMWFRTEGCKIQRSGSPGSYVYSVPADWAYRPVNFVSWGDAARFANWMHNGQPDGPQGLSTTEGGSYSLNGATSDTALLAVTRSPSASWVIPSENEWYKAAYHQNDGPTNHYWDWTTRTNDLPSNDLVDPDPGNNANVYDNDYTIGSPYYRTPGGEFENSFGPYGAFDQGGNVAEWHEGIIGSNRGVRGGAFDRAIGLMLAHVRDISLPTGEHHGTGFRLAWVPEPSPLALLALGSIAILRRMR